VLEGLKPNALPRLCPLLFLLRWGQQGEQSHAQALLWALIVALFFPGLLFAGKGSGNRVVGGMNCENAQSRG
jgi:hypothetical protein